MVSWLNSLALPNRERMPFPSPPTAPMAPVTMLIGFVTSMDARLSSVCPKPSKAPLISSGTLTPKSSRALVKAVAASRYSRARSTPSWSDLFIFDREAARLSSAVRKRLSASSCVNKVVTIFPVAASYRVVATTDCPDCTFARSLSAFSNSLMADLYSEILLFSSRNGSRSEILKSIRIKASDSSFVFSGESFLLAS